MDDVYYHSQRYRQVGDRIQTILAERDLGAAGFAPEKPRNFPTILALVTFFQYVEGYTDKQAAEAVRLRADWKYALHLPLSYPGFDAIWLCRLREYVFGTEPGAAFIRALAERLGHNELFDLNRVAISHNGTNGFGSEPVGATPAVEILNAICRLNRLVQVTEAMLLAVEALAAQESARLPALRLAQLYESYARIFRSLREMSTCEEAVRLALRIGADIASLMASVGTWGEKDLIELPEVHYLRKIWRVQYHRPNAGVPDEPVCIWQPVDCYHCNLDARGS